jgi:hypothetical protein
MKLNFSQYLDFTKANHSQVQINNFADCVYYYCVNKINELDEFTNKKTFYVGCTNSPKKRIEENEKNLSIMYLLCKINDKEMVQFIDKILVDGIGDLKNNYSMVNDGKKQDISSLELNDDGPYYIYILF